MTKAHHITLTSTIRIKDEDSTPALQEERVPTPAELGNILRSGPPDARVAASLIAFSGLRPEVLGNYPGTDGLRLADLPELVGFKATPGSIVVRESLSKAGHQYREYSPSNFHSDFMNQTGWDPFSESRVDQSPCRAKPHL